MKDLKGCFSHKTDDWKTPKKLFDYFINAGFIDCFPFHADYDEFKTEYCNQKLFVNPPFSKLDQVADWIWHQYIDNKCYVVLLIPALTDTKYFHKLLKLQPEIVFLKGRLHFNESLAAPFPSILMVFHFGLCMYRSFDINSIN